MRFVRTFIFTAMGGSRVYTALSGLTSTRIRANGTYFDDEASELCTAVKQDEEAASSTTEAADNGDVMSNVGESLFARIPPSQDFRAPPSPKAARIAQRRLQRIRDGADKLSWEKAHGGLSFARVDPAEKLEHCMLTVEEARFHRCPPGDYVTREQRRAMEARLRLAVCQAKSRGWKPWVAVHNQTMNYKERGFATFESALYPKDPGCRDNVPGQQFVEDHRISNMFRMDIQPPKMPKDVCLDKQLEFHRTWKVASSSLPQYLQCQIGCDWQEVAASERLPNKTTTVAAVRNPLSRWLSGMGEILQRVINGNCPDGPCTEDDGWYTATPGKTTRDSVYTSTSWYSKVSPESGGYSPDKLGQLVKDFAYDTKCNYDYYAAAHVTSQSTYVVQNEGEAQNIDIIMRLENIDAEVANLSALFDGGGNETQNCTLVPSNVEACKPQRSAVPTSSEIFEVLESMPELVQELCLIYAQDFICFDYELPDVCKTLF